MKISAHSPIPRGTSLCQTSYSLTSVVVLLLCVVALSCDKAISRATDPMLPRVAASITTGSAGVHPKQQPLCDSLPSDKTGAMAIQELSGERSLTLVYRFDIEQKPEGSELYSVRSVFIETSPKQIAWHARLEEEIESWEGEIRTDDGTNDVAKLSIAAATPAPGGGAGALDNFRRAIAYSMGCLHTLRQWCSRTGEEGANPVVALALNLPGSPKIELRSQNATTADVTINSTSRFELTATQQGAEWTQVSPSEPRQPPAPKSDSVQARGKTIFRLLSTDKNL